MEHSQSISKKYCEHTDSNQGFQWKNKLPLNADGWQNAISDTYFDLKVQVKRPNQFTGHLQQSTLTQMGISSYVADPVHYQRSGQGLSEATDSILLTFPLNGSVSFQQQKRQLTCHPGQFFIELSHQPYQFYHVETVKLQVLKVPISKLENHQRLVEKYFAQPITTEQGSGRLLNHQIGHTLHLATNFELSCIESELLEQQLDPYLFLKGAYEQNRLKSIYDGNPPARSDDDLDF